MNIFWAPIYIYIYIYISVDTNGQPALCFQRVTLNSYRSSGNKQFRNLKNPGRFPRQHSPASRDAHSMQPNQTFKSTGGPHNWSCGGAAHSTQERRSRTEVRRLRPKLLSFGKSSHELRASRYGKYNDQWNGWHAICFVSYVRVVRSGARSRYDVACV